MKVSVTICIAALGAMLAILIAQGCYDIEACRHNPTNCGGKLGAVCERHADCEDKYCCTEATNCGGGMCTLPCADDYDCPGVMRCRHDVCFFRCKDDSDCAEGQSCVYERICEWP